MEIKTSFLTVMNGPKIEYCYFHLLPIISSYKKSLTYLFYFILFDQIIFYY